MQNNFQEELAKLKATVDGVLTYGEMIDPSNENAKAFSTERGETFEFFDGETFSLLPKDDVLFRPKKFDGGVSLSIAINRGGMIDWMPIAILRRTCGLIEERELLRQENEIGNPLRANMSDIARVELLYSIVGDRTVRASVIKNVHANRYERGKAPIYDSPLMEEKDRKPLRAYRFNFA